MRLNIPIKQVDSDLPLPKYETAGSVGFDLICRESVEVNPGCLALIPANVIIAIPQGYMLMVTLRSSTPRKHGLLMPHGIGIIDRDYCGPNDEIKVQVFNFSQKVAKIERGSRIAQGVLLHVDRAEWIEITAMSDKSRGGFGSTGG